MNKTKSWLWVGTATLAVLTAAPAFAQETAAQDDNSTLIEEVVVTAEKRSQNVQDVPVAISAFSDERREDIGIANVQDLTNFTPGMAYTTGNDRVSVRGISRFSNNRSSEGGVAIYVDGVYSSSTTAGNLSTLFVDRTEVLRGPQGTLYGRNSVGGAINFISKRPTDELAGELRASIQNYEQYNLEGAVSGPISDHLRYRLAAGISDQREGYFKNLSGPSEGGRGQQIVLEAQLEGDALDEKLEWWLKGQWVSWDNIGRGPGGRLLYVLGPYNTTSPVNGITPYPTFLSPFVNQGNNDPFLIDVDTPNNIGLNDEQVTAQVTYHMPTFDIRYIGGYHYYDYRLQTDVDGTSLRAPYTRPTGIPGLTGTGIPIYPRRENQYMENPFWQSHEINFASTGEGPTQWIGGLYFFREGSNYVGIDARMPDQANVETLVNSAVPNPLRQYALNRTDNVTWSQAIFGQVEHQLTDKLKITAGLRYTHDRRKTLESGRVICFLTPGFCPTFAADFTGPLYVTPTNAIVDESAQGPTTIDPVTGQAKRLLKNEWDAVTGTLNFDYKPDEDTLIYGKYTRGYKAGGFNAGAFAVDTTTDPEFIDAFEIGAKKTFGTRFQANASGFYYNYQDIQAPLTVITDAGTQRTDFINLKKAEIFGFELETQWFPTDRLQILANYSFLNAKIKDPGRSLVDVNGNSTLPQDITGNQLPSSTPHRISLNANYTWDFLGGDLTASASYIWRSKTYYSIFNEPWNRGDSFGQTDARVIWRDGNDKYTVIGFVRNLTDELGPQGASRPGAPYASTAQQYVLLQPRTYGIEIQRRF